MTTFRFRSAASRNLIAVTLTLLYLSACSLASTPIPFRPPTAQIPLIEPTLIIQPTKQVVVVQASPLPTIMPTIDPTDCINNLRFVDDITVPDNSFTTFGSTVDKQ